MGARVKPAKVNTHIDDCLLRGTYYLLPTKLKLLQIERIRGHINHFGPEDPVVHQLKGVENGAERST